MGQTSRELREALNRADAYGELLDIRLPLHIIRAPDPGPADMRALCPLDLGPGMHVGLCWQANLQHPTGAARSIAPELLEPLRQIEGVTFHCVQAARDEGSAPAWVHRHALSNFDETMNLVAALDHVVTVSTCMAHLAGTLRRPTHVLLVERPATDRHLRRLGMPTLEGENAYVWGIGPLTPRYPDVRLYRGDIVGSIAEVCTALSAR